MEVLHVKKRRQEEEARNEPPEQGENHGTPLEESSESNSDQETKRHQGRAKKKLKRGMEEQEPLEGNDSPYIPTSPSEDGEEPFLPPTPTYTPPEDAPPPTPPRDWKQPQKSVKVLTTQQMPSLLSIDPETVRAYESNVRAWRASSQAEIRRDTWPRDVQARIEVDWLDSYEATKFGDEWRDNYAVSEEVFLSFLTKRYSKVRGKWDKSLS